MTTLPKWDADHLRLFVCHVASRRAFAAALSTELRPYATTAFVAHDTIQPTEEWQKVIEYALRTADAMVALLTPGFHQSSWTDQEVGACLALDKLVIPVRRGSDPYGFLARYQGLNARGRETFNVARDLFRILSKHQKTRARVASALVAQFEASWSYADAKAHMRTLEEIRYLDRSLVRRLRTAVAENGQIADAYGVPQRVHELVRDVKSRKLYTPQ